MPFKFIKMTSKNILTLTFSLCFVLFSTAQISTSHKIVRGDKYSMDSKKETLTHLIGGNSEVAYVLKKSKNDRILQKVNSEVSIIKEMELDLSEGKVEKTLEDVFMIDDNIYLFSSFYNKKKSANYLFYQKINPSSLELEGAVTKIAEVANLAKMNAFARLAQKYYGNSGSSFNIITSKDSTKILVHTNITVSGEDQQKILLTVFDTEMNELWTQTKTLPYDKDLYSLEKLKVDENGNAYALGKVYKDKKNKKRSGVPNYKYELLKFSDNGEKLSDYKIALSTEFITDVGFEIANNGDIACAGFYSTNKDFSIKGTWYMYIDAKTGEATKLNKKKFDLDFITSEMTEREEKKAQKKIAKGKSTQLYDYDLDRFIIRDDGGALLIAEQFHFWVTTTTSVDGNGNTRTNNTYHYNYKDIVVININPDGSIAWNVKIPKEQYTRNDGGYQSSYVFGLINSDKLIFVFNDDPGSAYRATKRSNSNKEFNDLMMYEVQSDGSVVSEKLLSTKDFGMLTVPKLSGQLSAKNILLYNELKKEQQFLKLEFE